MQLKKDGSYLFSVTDLTNFMACPFLLHLTMSGATPRLVVEYCR